MLTKHAYFWEKDEPKGYVVHPLNVRFLAPKLRSASLASWEPHVPHEYLDLHVLIKLTFCLVTQVNLDTAVGPILTTRPTVRSASVGKFPIPHHISTHLISHCPWNIRFQQPSARRTGPSDDWIGSLIGPAAQLAGTLITQR